MYDSDWDDPYALASPVYVEDYNCDVPEGMDLMVHRHRPRSRSNIVGWSPRYGDCRPDIGWVGSASGRDRNTDGCISMGFQRWNMDGDVQYQYETFNGMPVYYGGDLYDSDWDDPYALASPVYVEDYNCDVPEGMDLMVHRHSRIPDSLDVQQDCQMDVAPVYQTVSCATRDEWDTSDNDLLTEAADEDSPNMDDFYQ